MKTVHTPSHRHAFLAGFVLCALAISTVAVGSSALSAFSIVQFDLGVPPGSPAFDPLRQPSWVQQPDAGGSRRFVVSCPACNCPNPSSPPSPVGPVVHECNDDVNNDRDDYIDEADPECTEGSTSESGPAAVSPMPAQPARTEMSPAGNSANQQSEEQYTEPVGWSDDQEYEVQYEEPVIHIDASSNTTFESQADMYPADTFSNDTNLDPAVSDYLNMGYTDKLELYQGPTEDQESYVDFQDSNEPIQESPAKMNTAGPVEEEQLGIQNGQVIEPAEGPNFWQQLFGW